jgi:hypothetical protein
MSPLLVGLLKRLALWGLVGAAILVIGPPVLTEFGLLGPSLDEILEGTARSVETARLYGATDELPSFAAANRELEAAKDLGAHGEMRRARHAARRAGAHAIAAQREALARKEAERRRADAIHDEIDAALNELEDLYDRVERRNPKGAAEPLLSTMKAARQAGAGLILAYEEGNYRKVIVEEETVKQLLRAYREEIAKGGDALAAAAARRPSSRPGSATPRRADRR